jgi:DeoR family transcriptional regulator, myo-inositol catabolism operon repressor
MNIFVDLWGNFGFSDKINLLAKNNGGSKLIKEVRLKKIQEYINEKESVSLDELVSVFNVSKNTIRRDVQELLKTGDYKKIYGGVTVNHENKKGLDSFKERSVRNQEAKQLIGQIAGNLVNDGDVIFIDSGTTTIEMFEHIKNKKITIITNHIELIMKCIPHDNISLICIGGILERQTNSLGNINNLELLNIYNINKAFMSSTGISIRNGVTNASPIESKLKESVVRKCNEVYLLVDHSKFDKQGLITYCKLDEINYLVTDKVPNSTYRDFFNENHIKMIYK